MTLLHLNESKYFILIDKENKLLRFFQEIPFKWDHIAGRISPVYKKAKKKKKNQKKQKNKNQKHHKTEIWEKIENTPFFEEKLKGNTGLHQTICCLHVLSLVYDPSCHKLVWLP